VDVLTEYSEMVAAFAFGDIDKAPVGSMAIDTGSAPARMGTRKLRSRSRWRKSIANATTLPPVKSVNIEKAAAGSICKELGAAPIPNGELLSSVSSRWNYR